MDIWFGGHLQRRRCDRAVIKRIDRYVLKEMVVPVLTGTVVIAMLFLANQMIAIFKELDLSNVPPLAIARFILLTTPKWLQLTIPAGVALGCALALSRLTRDGELTAMRGAGVPVARVLRPVWIVGVLFGFLAFFNAEELMPVASLEERKMANELLLVATVPRFEQNMTLRLPPYVASFGEVQQTGEDGLLIRDVLLIERPRVGQATVYRADQGRYVRGVWTFEQARAWIFENDALVDVGPAERLVINQRIVLQDFFQGAIVEQATAAELWQRVEEGRLAGRPTRALEVAFFERYAVPAACVVFAYMGAVFAVRFSRVSPFLGLFVSFVAIWLYFNVHIIATQVIGRNGWLPPAVATWSPLVVFGLLSLWVGRSVE